MPRVYEDVVPTTVPTDADLIWAGTIFNIRGRRSKTGTRIYAYVDVKWPSDVPNRLLSLFGGRLYNYANMVRWTISGPRMQTFFELVRPHLDAQGEHVVNVILRETNFLAEISAEQAAMKEQRVAATIDVPPAVRRIVPTPPRPHVDLILSSEDFDQLDVIRIFLEDASSLTLSAATEAYATTWRDEIVAHLNDVISDVTVTGTIIRVTKRLAE